MDPITAALLGQAVSTAGGWALNKLFGGQQQTQQTMFEPRGVYNAL